MASQPACNVELAGQPQVIVNMTGVALAVEIFYVQGLCNDVSSAANFKEPGEL